MAFNYLGTVQKYLLKQALSQPWSNNVIKRYSSAMEGKFTAAVVIPAMAESDELPATLESLSSNPAEELAGTLVTIVVNNPPEARADVRANNLRTMNFLRESDLPLNLLLIDAFSTGLELPSDQGVGLARRIGMDLSLSSLCFSEEIAPVLLCLDADTRVEADYLAMVRREFSSCLTARGIRFRGGGAVIAYSHRLPCNPAERAAIVGYELYLRYYVAGLRNAGSPYDYHSIGSTMACTADAYCAVGGMPRRCACEDFYFMLKLAKLGPVRKVTDTVVHPSSRGEIRAPIGTGCHVHAAMARADGFQGGYSPDSFRILKSFLMLCEKSWHISGDLIQSACNEMDGGLGSFLESQNFSEAWNRISQNNPGKADLFQPFMTWFDGFRTMRLLNHLRENGYPDPDIGVAIKTLLAQDEGAEYRGIREISWDNREELLRAMRALFP
ncbi:MAG: hypothetical protein CVV64_02185 [Candidatus Wallbacteria bacterium HGW-Wallbacteria-1]|jgi:hypothetical protein|uniref:Glycosyltransferase 2-like domain-containing protein n=1 Tax=Candidatus Wallbacteria bacterium HGW-Wallbacteria-1 TaxID=2013854 RepID=A0A2N1PV88_9BACT|nr:MAG: hypothetical protein CVV64_02185 [Candidatus Wallbacteria bacterium HGW-Wallbacteria-1]